MSNQILSVIIATFSTMCLARSQGTLSWQFDTTAFFVQPTDQILLTGTLSNSSDSPFVIQGGGARFTGDLQWHYQVSWLFDISGATVPADGTIQFDYCILTPIGGFVQPGVYSTDPISNPASIFPWIDDIEYFLPSQNYFQITVVPEPSIICLGGVGLFLLSALSVMKRGYPDKMAMTPNHPASGKAGIPSPLTTEHRCPGLPDPGRSIRMTDHASGWFDRLREVSCGYVTEPSTTAPPIRGHGRESPRISRISRMETDVRGRSRRVLSVPIRVIRGQNSSGSNQALEPTETRVSVLGGATLTSPMVSGLRGSVPRSAS
jgi:hypothetical protein